MSADEETLAVYNAQAAEYAAMEGGQPENGLNEFLSSLLPDARILDLGCGTGQSARRMMDAGFAVDAVDASPAMIAQARARGVEARLARFEHISGSQLYHGIWANYSLLHAPRSQMAPTLARLHLAMKPNGLLHLGLKLGEDEERDALGRFYTYYSEAEIVGLLHSAGFTPMQSDQRNTKGGLAGTPFIAYWVQAHG